MSTPASYRDPRKNTPPPAPQQQGSSGGQGSAPATPRGPGQSPWAPPVPRDQQLGVMASINARGPTQTTVYVNAPRVYSPYRPQYRSYQPLSTADRVEEAGYQAFIDYKMSPEGQLPLSIADRLSPALPDLTWVADEYKAKYGNDAIEQQNESDAMGYEFQRNLLLGRDPRESSMASEISGALYNTLQQKLAEGSDADPWTLALSDYRTVEDNTAILAARHPHLFGAVSVMISQGKMTASDVASVTNLALAEDAATEIANTQNPQRQKAILAAQGNMAQQALVISVLNDKIKQEAAAQNETTATSIAMQVIRPLWDEFYKGSFELAFQASDLAQWGARAFTQLAPTAYEMDGIDKLPEVFKYAWESTAPGYITPAARMQMVEMYGEEETNIVLQALAARNFGEDDVVGLMYEQYADNDKALKILDSMFFSEFQPDSDPNEKALIQDLVDQALFWDRGNLGSLIAGQAVRDVMGPTFGWTEVWRRPGYTQTRDFINVSGWFLFDPFIIGGSALKAVRAMRYGIHLLQPGKVSKVMASRRLAGIETNKARIYWDDLGSQIKAAEGIEDPVAQAQAFRTIVRQEKRWLDDEAMTAIRQNKVYSADDAIRFLEDGDNIMHILRGQAYRRGWQKTVPIAGQGRVAVKRASRAVRRLDPTMMMVARDGMTLDQAVAGAANEMGRVDLLVNDAGLPTSFTKLTQQQQIDVLTELMNNEVGGEVIGRWLSPFTGKQTWLGKAVRKIPMSDGVRNAVVAGNRRGWQRRREARGFVDKVSRAVSRVPDNRFGLDIDTPADAQKVYQELRYMGVPRWWATYVSELWKEATPGQRRLILTGMTRTNAYAAGVHLVNPERGIDDILSMVTGTKPSDLYAANSIPGAHRMFREAEQELVDRKGMLTRQPGESAQDFALRQAERREETLAIWRQKMLTVPVSNPGTDANGVKSAVFLPQTRNRVAFPSISELDPLTAQTSYLNGLLGQNKGMQWLTDAWVFLTLAGPRFTLRNVIEDYAFWFMSAGRLTGETGLRTGRRASQAKRQVLQRLDKETLAAETRVNAAKARYETVLDDFNANRGKTEADVEVAQDAYNQANKDWERLVGSLSVKTQKLGIVKRAARAAATALMGTKWAKEMPDDPMDFLRAIVHPYLADNEIEEANRLFGEGQKDALAQLLAKAFVRERIFYLDDPNMRGVQSWIAARNGSLADLNDADRQVVEWLEQYAKGRNGFTLTDAVTEEGRNMIDSTMPAFQPNADMTVVGSEILERVFIGGSYESMQTVGATPQSVDAVWHTMVMSLHGDGPKSQQAMRLLVGKNGWMRAGDNRRSELVDELAAYIMGAPEQFDYMRRFSLATTDNARQLARATFETLENVFTTADGRFNSALYSAVRRKGEDGSTSFRLWDKSAKKADGTYDLQYRVTKQDFAKKKYELPGSYLTFQGTSVYVTPGRMNSFVSSVWDWLGQSMARMTREPMFMSNYIDARRTLQPLEARLKEVHGENWWKVADDAATEMAYNLTLGYVDNPAVRSKLAWQVRNVARFYRATEDFYRRSYRIVTENPMGVWKAALALSLQDDSGWIHVDENGERYFIYPGTRPVFEAVNAGMNALNVGGAVMPSAPLSFSGRTSWLTPSADPDAAFPTFSGFVSGISLRAMFRAMPSLDTLSQGIAGDRFFATLGRDLERGFLGPIGADQEMIRASFPTHIIRTLDLIEAIRDTSDEFALKMDGAVASAGRSAVVAGMASGMIPTDRALTSDERSRIMARVDAMAVEILTMRLIGGFILPASPQLTPDDVSTFSREMGMYSIRQGFLELTDRMTYEEALVAWYKANPDLAPYTLSESGDKSRSGYWRSTDMIASWVEENQDVVDQFPTGAAVLAPDSEDAPTSLKAYQFLQRQGLNPKASVGSFLDDMSTQSGWIHYQVLKMQYEQQKADALAVRGQAPEVQQANLEVIENRWMNAKDDLFSYYPGLEGRVVSGPADQSADMTIREIRGAAEMLAQNGDARAGHVRDLISTYESTKSTLNRIRRGDPAYDAYRDDIRERWKSLVITWNNFYPGDEQFNRILRLMTGDLGFRIDELG